MSANKRISASLVVFGIIILAIVAVFLSMVYIKINPPMSSDRVEIESLKAKKSQDSVLFTERIESVSQDYESKIRTLIEDTARLNRTIREYQSDTL